jgi:glutathione S-transferase
MLTLHHLEQSRSFRIIWALEELGVEYDIKLYKRLPTLAAPKELRNVHPLGKSPILTHDDEVIAESAVILDYLQETYDAEQIFKPQNKANLRQYQYWMHYSEGSLMPYLVMTLVMTNVPKHVPFLIRPIASKITGGVRAGFLNPRIKENIGFLEDFLSKHQYFAGEFSFADVQMYFPLKAIQERVGGSYPNISAYLQRVTQRPAYNAALIREQNLEKI